jgi:WD40 repeat protein
MEEQYINRHKKIHQKNELLISIIINIKKINEHKISQNSIFNNIGQFFCNDISCMEGQWICKKTIILPNKVSCISLDEKVKKVAFVLPVEMDIQSLQSEEIKRVSVKASYISFDNSSNHLAFVTNDNNLKIIDLTNKAITEALPQTIDEKYTAIKCVNGRECLVGSDNGKLWKVKINEYPQLLHYFHSERFKNDKYSVATCDIKNDMFAVMAVDIWGGILMRTGDIKDQSKGWEDGTVANPGDICFSRDGSLVAFAAGNIVLVYVTAILEKSNQVWRDNNMTYNDKIKKALEGMQKACITYSDNTTVQKVVFHDNNKQIFAGLNDEKVYCSEVSTDAKPAAIVNFSEDIASLAFSNMVLAVAGFKKICLYSQQ